MEGLDTIVYLQDNKTLDTAGVAVVIQYIYNCIDGQDVLHAYQGSIPVSSFTSKYILTSINLNPMQSI